MRRHLFSIAVILLCAGCANAGTVYTDLTSFLDALEPGYYEETFGSSTAAPPSWMDFSGNGYSYRASAPSWLYEGPRCCGGHLFGPYNPKEPVMFEFTGATVTAIGGYFFLADEYGNVNPGAVEVTFSDGARIPVLSFTSARFLGYVSSTPLTGFTVSGNGDEGAYVRVDDLYVGARADAAATPEPASLLLAGGSLTGLWVFRRKRLSLQSAR